MDSPYQLDLGPFQAKVVIDKSRQTRLFLLGQAIIKAYWYAELRFGQNFLPFITSQVKTGIRNNFLLYDAVGKILNVDKVVDSSKSYLKAAELYRHHPDRVKILLLVRDGRAVFYSGLKNGFRRRRCVNVWRNAYTRAMPLLDRVVDPKDILWVHYENLAKDPENELRRVCEFATLEYQPDMLKFMEHDHHITNGNNMRFGTDSSIRFDESWRKGLTAKDAKYFNDRAKALNLSFGYE